jgi:hypothetical protein
MIEKQITMFNVEALEPLPVQSDGYVKPEPLANLALIVNQQMDRNQFSFLQMASHIYKMTGLKVEQSTIFQWSKGSTYPSLEVGSFLCQAWDITGDELLGLPTKGLPETLTIKLFAAVTNNGKLSPDAIRTLGKSVQYIPGMVNVATWLFAIADVVDKCLLWVNSSFNQTELKLDKISQLRLI